MRNENYKALDFGFDYSKEVICQSIHDDWEGFRIIVSAETKRWVRIKFAGVMAYRKIDEANFLATSGGISGSVYPLCEVYNSNFIEWFESESMGEYKKLRHFLLMTTEDIIDVLSYDPPTIELL